jgi:flagellar motor switch protein FliG
MNAFDDLELLDGHDLEAVLEQLPIEEVVAALWGMSPSLRGNLVRKLNQRLARRLEQVIAATQHLNLEAVRAAQHKVASVMCAMSRTGQIAFDMPEDMVA